MLKHVKTSVKQEKQGGPSLQVGLEIHLTTWPILDTLHKKILAGERR